MSSYTEHVTRVVTEDREHPGLGTVAVLTFAPPEGEERRPATLGPRSIDAVTGAIAAALDRAEAGEIREAAREDGKKIIAEAKETAASEAARLTATAHSQIEAERQTALVSLRSEVGSLALDLAGGVVGETLSDDARAAAVVDRFLADLEASEKAAQ